MAYGRMLQNNGSCFDQKEQHFLDRSWACFEKVSSCFVFSAQGQEMKKIQNAKGELSFS